MKIISTKINDLYIIEPQIFSDERGYFFESFNEQKFNMNFPAIKIIIWSFKRSTLPVATKSTNQISASY